MKLSRSSFMRALAGAVVLGAGALAAQAQNPEKVFRIGYQKYGNLVLLKGKGTLEPKLAALGYKVTWNEFPAGPQMLEALNVGSIDFAHGGEAPPIFAQAAGAPFVYVAHEPPAPHGEAILVPKDSPLKTVTDLKGKKVAFNKGSNVQYLVVKSLEKAGLKYSDIEPVHLTPADARAAFEGGKVDAWAIWDPYFSAAQAATGGRVLVDAEGTVPNNQFLWAARAFAEVNPNVIQTVVDELKAIDEWAKSDPKAVAEQLSPSVGIPAPVLEVALRRQAFGLAPLDAETIAAQQKIADTFFALGLLPKEIKVSDIVWRAGT